jgi:amino acid adenylation domain-containing protein/FkbH-like protein/non-ribosomal peptide synthase protein (TIGR01720 family)
MDRATLQAKIAALTPEQKEQLKQLLAAKREAEAKRAAIAPASKEASIPRVPEADDYALSFAQQRLWMQDELSEGGSAAYNVPLAVILRGELDVAALERAFRRLMERHAVLRTRFIRRNGEPRQVIESAPAWAIERWPEGERAAARGEFQRRAEAMANRPFALERELPFRAAAMPLAPQEHGLALVFHHIACDGRSVALLAGELERAYAEARQPEAAAAASANLRYVDFAGWHRGWMESPAGAKAKDFWVRQFAEVPEPLELPADRPRPALQDFSGGHLQRKLPPGTRERLTALGQRVGASLYGMLLAGVATFLHRYAGRNDITVGSPVEGRPRAEFDGIVGFFVNTLPLRTKLAPTDSFLAVVERVRDGVLEALEHQGCPFEVMVQSLPLERDLSRPPLFTVMMGLTRAQEEALRLPGIETEVVPLGLRTSKVDLTFHFVETAGGLELDLEYATALFDVARVQRLAECFETMLAAALAMPAGVIGDLSLLTEAQARAWLKAANPPDAAYPCDRSLASLFREQVVRNPDAEAVAHDGRTFTYAELDRMSDAVAGHLVGCLGALRTDEPIALQVDRSERMLAALLGILKAGGCYLPINPGTPLERVRTLLKLAGVRLRLVEGEPAVPDWSGVDVDLRAWCAQPPPVTASSGVGEGPGAGLRLAYIIFTSGSTGEPKGVLIEQHSVVRLVRNTDYLQLGPGDRVLQTGSLAFDASTFEIWGPLLNGGCCCLPRGKEILEIDQFGALVRATGATTCFLTTGLFNQIANFNPEAFRELKHVLTGGEKVSAPHVNRVLAAAPGLTLLHVYGPTENTTFSTWYRVRGECRHDVPIGRPLAHSTIYILDERGNVQPPGVVGEIYCGGDGIARGYLARPEATAERFVPDPFSGRPGTRLYRTGDFGRWDEAGNVEFAGRRDDQVKIRGFRIELGEVELRLRAQPAVQQAVVVARPAGGTHELVAYLVAPGLESEETLRAGLAKVLPDYMVPSYFVLLDALPLNASGKVNRKALPAPKPAQTETSGLAASFTDPKEQALAAAWSEVLGRPPAGADAHYFNSGGDSIKAIQMTARLRARGYRLTLREVFGRPRFTDLAAGLVADAATDVDATSATAEVPFTPIQRWFLETYSPPYDHFNQATLLEAGERLRPDLLRQAVEQLVARHGMLRCRLERSDANGGWRQTIPAGPGTIGWREEDLSSRSSGEAEAAYDAATARLQRGLSLAEGRLVAAGFFRLASSDRVLLVIHHWAVDGLSWRILVDELETIYRGLAAGDAQPKLAAPGVFRAWAQSLAAYGKSEALAQEARYWQAIADRMPHVDPAPALPATERRETVFSAELTQRLLTDAHRAYGTRVDELLLAAFGKAWADAGGPEPLALAMEGHGRESCVGPVDVSATVGWCTSMWPFVLAGGGEWPERIRAVKDALRTVPDRGVGYGVLRHLQGALPAVMPRVSFNYLGVFEASRGALFRGVVDVTTGETVAAHLGSPFDLDVVGEVNGGCLRVSFHFHRSAQTADQRSELVTAFGRALEAAVAEGSGGTPRRSLADFTGGVANRAELDRLLQHCAERRLEVEDILPLTPMQEGMVFHSLYEPQSAAYSDQVVLRLRGPLDAPTFEAAWQALGRQYPNLRASFLATETERPVSVIAPGTRLGFAWREASDGAELAALRAEERARKFDLQNGPLLRLTLVKLGSDEHEAILAFHHSILDGWSSGLIWQRLEENYRAVAAGRPMPAVRGAFRDFLRWLRGRDSQSDLAYWKTLLAGAAGVGVPTGAPRLGAPAVRTRSCSWEMGRERTERFLMAARRLGTTENSLFQTLWGILLGKLTRRNDVTFGATVSGRAEGVARVEEIVGLLINTIPVRVAWGGETTFQELAERLRLQSADSMERISVSLAEIQGATDAAASLVQHTLVFENYPAADEAGALWRTETVEVHDPMHFEFGLLVVPKRDAWTCRVVADEARYPDAYLNALQLAWHEVVDHYLAAPEGAIEGWEPKVAAGGRLRRIAVAATFTAEPIEEPLRFWLHSRGDEAQVQFAPFNQVLQQLLDPGSDLLRIRAEFNVLLVRLEDWAGSKRTDAALVEESLDLNSDLFVDGLQRLVDAAPSARSLVIFCPPSVETRGVAGLSETLAAAERRLRRRIDGPRLGTVRAVGARELLGRFRDVCADNVAGEALGGVPYAEEFFAVLACEVVRRWDAQTRAPFKVLALDADQTLWQGVLGEDGVSGIALTQGHRRLQDVAKTARAGGMLLVLVTKNNLEDVKEAFRIRGEMPLRWDDFVAVQANWRPKSESLRTLARELRLGLDSFVFLDDSGVECAEVRAALPEVLTLQVPADGEAIERFAEHLWPADVFAASAEDQQRSELYQTESRREAVRAASGGLRNFVRQLQLAIEVVAIGEANLERAAQLTQRTNQFNASTVRRPAAEIRDFLERAGHGGFLLEVKDRFGDYGLTGLILFRDEGDSRVVDTFLLSCRVLGRGVEHELLRRLGREAAARRLTTLRVNFAATAKNAPAEQFLRACAGREERDATGVTAFVFDAATASAVEIAEAVSELRADDRPAGREAPAATRGAVAHFYQTVATDLSSARGLVAAAQAIAQRSRQRRTSAAYEAPRDGDERRIAEIWAAVLGVERVGRQDDFFALGGHSLKAVMMLSRVNRALGRELLLEAIFERPVLAEFAAHVGANAGPPSGPTEITRAPDAADYPLSHAQRRLWLIEQMRTEPPSPFHMAAVFSLRGALDEARLAAAFRRVIERHESLRTGLVLVGSEPRQRVSACADFSLERLDGGDVTEFIEREFDLARPPLLRAGLCREDGQGWTLVVVMHHAVSDGWSIGVMAEELSAFYRDPAFAPVPLGIHYRDYTVWQERQLAQGAWRRASDYWRQLFRDLPAPLELPADRVRPAIKQSRGAEVQATLPAAAWADVKAAAQRAGASPFGVVLAALQVLLARHARTSRFVIGTPVAGRDAPELESQIGFFVNLLPLVAEVDGARSFHEHLAAVKDSVARALSHAAYPFDRLVNDLALPREMSRSPLFDVLLVFQSNREAELSLGDVALATVQRPSRTSQYELTFEVVETPQGLRLRLEYATSLFDAARMQRMARQLMGLLANAFANPTQAVAALELCPPEERERIRGFERGAKFGTLRARTIPQLVREAAADDPSRVAVAVGARTITYAELEDRTRVVAAAVHAAGAAAQELIAVAGDRCEDFICALLGVMRAGCVYVPLDLKHPDERLRLVVEDGGMRRGIAIGAEAERRMQGLGLELIDPDDGEGRPKVRGETVHADELAYVIFTSGSTGRPKGVEITHASFATMIASQVRTFGVRSDDRCAWWASCAFDASLSEIFLGLTTGATVVIAEAAEREDPVAFLEWLRRLQVTVITLPPAFLRVLQREPLASVRVLITAGEAADAGDLLHYARDIETFNAYGPTETSVCATIQRVEGGVACDRTIPIGRPLDVAAAYVLDANRRRVPLGVPGELFVGGRIVGRGYRGAAELTAERFLPDPFAETPGARMYRTGDLVRWREDGVLEFLGREDDQVKIRGFRIELGEVESALRAIAGVRAAAVLALDRLGTKALVAYVVGEALGADALRAAITERLPDYMRPSAYCLLERLPTTPNGKLDKAALPHPDWAGSGIVTAPDNERERVLARAWTAALGIERIGQESHFFTLGGDSIKALTLAASLRAAGWQLSLKSIFAHPVLSEQARQMRAAAKRQAREVSGAVALLPIQKWFLESHRGAPLQHFNQALFYRAAERIDVARLQRAVQAVWVRHAGLRAVFAQRLGDWAQFVQPASAPAPVVQTLDVSGQADARLAIAAWVKRMQSGFELAVGPLVRYGVVHEAAGDRVLCVTHHLVSDWVSHRLLLEDLEAAYVAADNAASMLQPAVTELDEWMQAGAAWAADDSARQDLIEAWRGIAHAAARASIGGRAESTGCFGEVRVLARKLEPELTEALRGAVAGRGSGALRDVVLAGMAAAEKEVFRRDRLAVQLEGHGRSGWGEHLDVSRTVGWFTSLYPCVLEHRVNESEMQAIARVGAALAALPDAGATYGLLRAYGPATARSSELAVPTSIGFNYLGEFAASAGTGVFRIDDVLPAGAIADDFPRDHPRDVTAWIFGEQLHVQCAFLPAADRDGAMERWIDHVMAFLLGIARSRAG